MKRELRSDSKEVREKRVNKKWKNDIDVATVTSISTYNRSML